MLGSLNSEAPKLEYREDVLPNLNGNIAKSKAKEAPSTDKI